VASLTRIKNNQQVDANISQTDITNYTAINAAVVSNTNQFDGIYGVTKIQNYSITGDKWANSVTAVTDLVLHKASTGGGAIGGNLTVEGNLTVIGSVTSIEATTTRVSDSLIQLGYGNDTNGIAASADLGFIFTLPADNAALIFDQTANRFELGFTSEDAYSANAAVTFTQYANLKLSELDVLKSTIGNIIIANSTVTTDGSSAQNLYLIANSGSGNVYLYSNNSIVANNKTYIQANLSAQGNLFVTDYTIVGLTQQAAIDLVSNSLGLSPDANTMPNSGDVVAQEYYGTNFWANGNVTIAGNLTTSNVTIDNDIVVSGSITANTITAAQNLITEALTVNTDAYVSGNLVVSGNVTYVNTVDLVVEDPILGLGRGANNAPLVSDDNKDRGLQLWYYDSTEKSAFVGWDDSAGQFVIATDATVSGEVVSVNDYGNIVLGNLQAQAGNFASLVLVDSLSSNTDVIVTSNTTTNNLTVNSTATISGTLEGNTALFDGNIDSNSTSTGTVVITGGLGISGNINVGETSNLGNIQIFSNNITNKVTDQGITIDANGVGDIVFNSNLGTGNILVNGSQPNLFVIKDTQVAITSNLAYANAFVFRDNITLDINATDAIRIPVGNVSQRPVTVLDSANVKSNYAGAVRFNSEYNILEYWNGSEWQDTRPQFTLVTPVSITGANLSIDGNFTLPNAAAGADSSSTIVSINGVLQAPGTAYVVTTGNVDPYSGEVYSPAVITFDPADLPANTDIIDIRSFTTTSKIVTAVVEFNGIKLDATQGNYLEVTGNVLPIANVTYDLGSTTKRWNELWLANSTIHMGGLQIKTSDAGLDIYREDGTTLVGSLHATHEFSTETDNFIELDLDNGAIQILKVNTNTRVKMPLPKSNKSFTVMIKQLGGYSLSWEGVQWPNSRTPDFTSIAGTMDIYEFYSDGEQWYGAVKGTKYLN
jgi:hypothetical protein